MRVGVVADNHGFVDRALATMLRGMDEIWHAGDLVTADILDALRMTAPVHAVRGNNDIQGAVRALPEELLLERLGVRVLLRHIVGPPGKVDALAGLSISRLSPHVVIMGHSHKPLAVAAGGVVYLNPGSCGPRRFSLPRTAATLELTQTQVRFRVVDLDTLEMLGDTALALRA